MFDHFNNPILNQWFNGALKLSLTDLWIPSKYVLMVDPNIDTIIIGANMAEDYIQIVYPPRIIERIDINKVFPYNQIFYTIVIFRGTILFMTKSIIYKQFQYRLLFFHS